MKGRRSKERIIYGYSDGLLCSTIISTAIQHAACTVSRWSYGVRTLGGWLWLTPGCDAISFGDRKSVV